MKRLISSVIALIMGMQLISSVCAAEQTYTITIPTQTYQTVKGWGVFPSSVSSGFLNKAAAHKALYHELGITQFRIELRGQAGDAQGNLIPDVYGQFISNIKLGHDNGIDNYSVHIWSPPPGMKDNNSIAGLRDDGKGAKLLPEYEQKFCDWIVTAFQGIEDAGLPLPMALSFQNEPEVLKEYQSCGYDSEQYVRVAKLLRKTLDAAGYEAIQLMGPEGGGYRSNTDWFGKEFSVMDSDPELVDAIDAFASHSYPLKQGSPDSDLVNYLAGCDKYPEKDRWQTEWCNGNSLGNTQVDRTMTAISTLNADMVWGRNNYWLWWIGFDTRYSIDAENQEVLLGGDGVANVVKSAQFNMLSKIYNNVPVGSKVKRPVSDDPELKTQLSLTNDMSAYISPKGTTLVVVNRSKESKRYHVEGLTGKSVVVSSVSNTFEGMQDIAQRNIENGQVENVMLPPESVNVFTTHLTDVSPPNVKLDLSDYWQIEDGTYVVRDSDVVLNGSSDEKAIIEMNRSEVALDENMSFRYHFKAAKYSSVTVIACDESKNYASPQIIKFSYNPSFVDVSLKDLPDKTNDTNMAVNGAMNINGTVTVNGTEVKTMDDGSFTMKLTLQEGENTITVKARDEQGNQSQEKVYSIFCDSVAPELTLNESSEVCEDMEYVLSGGINEAGRVEVNGAAVPLREDLTFNTKIRLQEGVNHIEMKAIDESENVKAVTKTVTYTKTENSPHETDMVSYSKKAAGNVTVDGDLSEWKIDNKATKVTLGEPNNIVNFATMWNEQYLYIGAQITDDKKLFENKLVYQNDAVEIFINPGNEKIQKYMPNDRQLFIGYAENGKELYVNTSSKCLTGWKNTETGYTVEMAIPWLEMGVEPSIGKAIGFDLSCDDKDKPGDRESVIFWAGTNDNWKDTSNFGTLYLVEEKNVQYIDKPEMLPPINGGDVKDLELTAHFNGAVLTEEAISQMNDFEKTELYAGEQKLDPEGFIYQKKAMVPVRAVAQLFGKTVTWNSEKGQAMVGETVIDTVADCVVHGEQTIQPAGIYLENGTMFLPLEVMKTVLAQ